MDVVALSATRPISKLSFRFAEKTTSPRSAETSKDSIAANCGVNPAVVDELAVDDGTVPVARLARRRSAKVVIVAARLVGPALRWRNPPILETIPSPKTHRNRLYHVALNQ